ncbi:MlaC/ttg2D family ABC transporter substrate-binding protein [Kushneria konosiri]|uniref:Toluene tolerance protein n=1 Tax=Kushneria konosiri TaxID=698828 RepID=A0A2Z2H9X3_9GAMM|nr:ABC transporter substrate-binding protein [Kushneria konosiri]ARS54255.1 toluene tolerance protein [Kushneria konosiri]
MKRVSRYVGVLVAVVLGMGILSAQAASQSPHEVVSQSVEQLMSKLDNNQDRYRNHPDELKSVVEQNIDPIVDWRYASASVMGKYFQAASPEQRSKFARVFKQTLIDTYAQGLVTFDYKDVRVMDDNNQRYDDQASVDMEVIASSGERYPVSYTLRNRDGSWKVINVVVNGINLGLTFRNQFDQAMRANHRDFDAVINGWAPDVDLKDGDGDNQKAQG